LVNRLDASASAESASLLAKRWRGLLRYKFGPDIAGWSFGVAASF